eukprot:54747-Eustigmatos_ZCMA.PRE.1
MGEHPIHAAAKTGDLGELRALIAEDRRCVYDEDDYSMTPLIWAAYGKLKWLSFSVVIETTFLDTCLTCVILLDT